MVLQYPSRVLLSILLVVVVLAVGCSKDSSEVATFEVTGKITLDGKPMAKGTIAFEPDPPTGTGLNSTEIKDGTYSLRLPAGKHKVQFSLEKMVPSTMEGVEEMEPKELLPARYNVESTITMEVSAEKEKNEFNYELLSR